MSSYVFSYCTLIPSLGKQLVIKETNNGGKNLFWCGFPSVFWISRASLLRKRCAYEAVTVELASPTGHPLKQGLVYY